MQSSSDEKTLVLKGSYAIDRASDLARDMSNALGLAKTVNIDITDVEELDLPALQVLYAAAASARARGGALHCTGTASAALCGRLLASGFSIAGPLPGAEFEAHLPGFGRVTA